MKNIAVLPNRQKARAASAAAEAVRFLRRCGLRILAEEENRDIVDADEYRSLETGLFAACDAAVVFGGDGTLLRANALAVRCNLPLLGVNVGRVGFLTEVELDRLEEACARLANEEYTLETRMMLKASMGDRTDYALNDVVLSRGGYSRLIGVNAWVDGDRDGPFIEDGRIVSNPTGTTGYSLSAGGPLVCPEVECMVLTPICAHSLQHRPVVTSAAQTITVRLDGGYSAMVSVDGRKPWGFSSGQTLTITKAEHAARFIRLGSKSFFSTIRIKLSEWTRS